MNTNYAVDFIGRSRKEIILLKKRIANFRGNTSILNSKVVYVNYDLTINDTTSKVFKTVAEAQTWITANAGTLSASNTWTIKLPSGTITEPLVKLPFIDFEPSAGTIINELTSGVVYSTLADLFKAIIGNTLINTINIPAGMCLNLQNCFSNLIVIEDNTSRLFAIGGIFNDLDLGNSECDFYNAKITGDISNFNDTSFTRCTLEGDITIATGETLTLVNSVCTSITNNGTLNNYQPTFDSDVIASEATKGCIRYTEGEGYSRCQMVMKDGTAMGATTWEWVTIKENTW